MKSIEIAVSDEIRNVCPDFRGAAVFAKVKNSKYDEELWNYISIFTQMYRDKYTLESLKEIPAISATRQAYKRCGKDPSRYRPSSEALCRRILKGDALYQINTLVDLINVVSIRCGHSIGGFDADKIRGEKVELCIGKAGQPYEGIGRGSLNIEGLPVYNDAIGGIGTPTSDNERTKIELSTSSLLAIINAYNGDIGLESEVLFMIELLKKYTDATDIVVKYFE